MEACAKNDKGEARGILGELGEGGQCAQDLSSCIPGKRLGGNIKGSPLSKPVVGQNI